MRMLTYAVAKLTAVVAQVPNGDELKSFEAARQANELQSGGYA